MKRLNLLIAPLTFAVMMMACTGCEEGDTPGPEESTKKKTAQNTNGDKPEIEIQDHPDSPSPDMVENIEQNLQTFMNKMSNGDFHGHLEMMYPAIWINDSLMDSGASMMQEWWDKGWQNKIPYHQITAISPLVELEKDVACVVWFDAQVQVVFTEAFTGVPENYGNMIRDKYGPVTFDPETRTWSGDSKQKMYAFSPKDEIDFKFLNESYFRSPQFENLIPYDKYMEIRDFEYE